MEKSECTHAAALPSPQKVTFAPPAAACALWVQAPSPQLAVAAKFLRAHLRRVASLLCKPLRGFRCGGAIEHARQPWRFCCTHSFSPNSKNEWKPGCNLNESVRITAVFFYTKALFMGFFDVLGGRQPDSVAANALESPDENKIMRDSSLYVRPNRISFSYHKRLFQRHSVLCDR